MNCLQKMTSLWGVSKYFMLVKRAVVALNKQITTILIIVQTLKSGTPIRFSLTAISDYVLKLLESHIKQVRIWNIESLLLLTNDNKRGKQRFAKSKYLLRKSWY